MAIALVSGQFAWAGDNTAGTTIAVAFPANVTAGNLIVTWGACFDPQIISTVTDTPGNSYANAVHFDAITAGGVFMDCWYAKNILGGPCTVQNNYSASIGGREIGVSEYSGADTATPLDQTAGSQDSGTAAVAISSPDKTPPVAGCLIWGAIFSNGATPTANSPYTLLHGVSSASGSEFQVQGAAAAVHSSFATTGAVNWSSIMAIFKPASAAATARPTPTVVRQAVSRSSVW